MPLKFRSGLWWVEWLARGLSPGDRDAVLGDLAEAGETGSQAFLSVAGLLIRRQLWVWRDWRPWVASFGLAMPASFLLMGFSVSIAQNYQHVFGNTVLQATGLNVPPRLTMLLCDVCLLAVWSATGGFAVGTISRRTTWVSATFCLLPCVFCLARFRMANLSPLCLFLFVPPAVGGFFCGLRTSRVRFTACLAVAIVTTALTIPHWNKPGPWLPTWILSWPAWYLVAIAWRRKALLRNDVYGK